MRVRFQRLLIARILGPGSVALAAWAAAPASALAQVPETREPSLAGPPAFVFGNAGCPDPKTVQQAVLGLIPPERYALLEHGVRVELEDLGESYRVTVWKEGASLKKGYADPARDCDGRARFAAVFTVLTLMPPELGAEATAKPEPKPETVLAPAAKPVKAEAESEPPHTPTLPPFVQLELSALYAHAPPILEAPSLHSFGGELRLGLGRGELSGTLSVAYTPRAQFDLDGVHGDVARLPLSVGARLRTDFDSWSLAADLGLLVVAQHVRATNLLLEHSRGSAEVGVRVGVQIARKVGSRFAPFVGAFVWFTPAPSDLSALPQGVIGNLPYVWLGGAAGVSFGL